jgi:hypothetical protein
MPGGDVHILSIFHYGVGGLYLREPNVANPALLMSINEVRGFPGMVSIIHFMH